jgi:hypothetical protein
MHNPFVMAAGMLAGVLCCGLAVGSGVLMLIGLTEGPWWRIPIGLVGVYLGLSGMWWVIFQLFPPLVTK